MANSSEMNGCIKNVSPRKKSKSDDLISKVTVILGAQWGDEGKGKVVDMLATSMDIVCRCQVSFGVLFHSYHNESSELIIPYKDIQIVLEINVELSDSQNDDLG